MIEPMTSEQIEAIREALTLTLAEPNVPVKIADDVRRLLRLIATIDQQRRLVGVLKAQVATYHDQLRQERESSERWRTDLRDAITLLQQRREEP